MLSFFLYLSICLKGWILRNTGCGTYSLVIMHPNHSQTLINMISGVIGGLLIIPQPLVGYVVFVKTLNMHSKHLKPSYFKAKRL